MFQNYVKIALRNLRKYRFYSLINIAGLTVGMACCLFIFLFVKAELSYDRYHPTADRLYRLNFIAKLGDQKAHIAATPMPSGPTLKQEIPEVEAFCRLRDWGNEVVHYENQDFKEAVVLADSSLFRVFGFSMLEGNPETALAAPNSVVITRRMAEKYFGSASPLGKTIRFGAEEAKITGIMEDIPRNTHFHFDFFRSLTGFSEPWGDSWGGTNYYTYFLLREGADPQTASEKATPILVKNLAPVLEEFLNTTWDEFVKAGNYARLEFFPVKDIHLHSDLNAELAANGDIQYVYIFGIIGLFILALACINFMNLSTARSTMRAREVGVRKAVGALRSDLAKQFLSESILMSLLALALALIGLQLLLPAFNRLSDMELTRFDLIQPAFLGSAFALCALMGLAAGSYPAFLLSAFQPVKVLKSGGAVPGGGRRLRGAGGLRSALVVFQFFTTTVLLIGSLVVRQQMQFIRNKKLGFNKENVLVLHDPYLLGENIRVFKERMLQNPAVRSAAVSQDLPVASGHNASTVNKGRMVNQQNSILSCNWWVDHDYVKTMGLEIVEGRDFSTEIAADSSAVIINETMARSYGYPHRPVIGQEVNFVQDAGKLDIHHIVGVVKDFNFASLRSNIEPAALFRGDSRGYLSFRVETQNMDDFIKELRTVWGEMAPAQPFSFTFLDERFDRLYDAETRIGNVVGTFAILAIFIACIGLLGLATFTVQQRTKEIGVRKVLGASVASVVALLSKEFLSLVVLSLIVAAPVAWYFMNQWLQDFAYRVNLHWWVFALSGAVALALAFLTVSFQSVKAALANPVRSLQSE